MKTEEITGRLVLSLSDRAETGPAANLAELVVEHALAVRLDSWLDAEQLAATILVALRSAGGAILVERQILPALAAERERAADSGERLGDLVPETVVEAIEDRAKRPAQLPDGWGRGIVDPKFVNRLLTGVLQDTLEAFTSKLPLGGSGSLLKGRRQRPGKSGGGLLGGIGKMMQQNIKRTTADFAKQSAGKMRGLVEQRLRTPESRDELKAMRKRAIDAVLSLQVSELIALSDDPGPEEITRLALSVLEHNAQRPEVETAIHLHLTGIVERSAEQTGAELLADFDLYDQVRGDAVDRVRSEITAVAETTEFASWLTTWVSAAMSDPTDAAS